MDVYTFLIQLLNSVQYGLLLFLVASGLTLIFGIMGIVNLAHGSFYMIGAYMAFSLSALTGNLFVAIVLGVVLSVALGAALEWALFSRLYKRDHLQQVLLTFGLILVFEEVRSILVGNDVHGVAVPHILDWSLPLTATLSYPVYRLFMSGVCLVLAVLLYFLIARTRLGMMIRAGASNRDRRRAVDRGGVAKAAYAVVALVFAMAVSGAFVAGIRAGFAYNTFPLMNGAWIPSEIGLLDPWWKNPFWNMATVQFDHRLLAWILAFAVPVLCWRVRVAAGMTRRARTAALVLVAALAAQIALGIATLLLVVPVHLAACHQAGALLVFACALNLAHAVRDRNPFSEG